MAHKNRPLEPVTELVIVSPFLNSVTHHASTCGWFRRKVRERGAKTRKVLTLEQWSWWQKQQQKEPSLAWKHEIGLSSGYVEKIHTCMVRLPGEGEGEKERGRGIVATGEVTG